MQRVVVGFAALETDIARADHAVALRSAAIAAGTELF
jgi:hypothetical protein